MYSVSHGSFPSANWALLDCVIDQKVRDMIFEAILSPSERNQNIQDNPEYNSVLAFRIILKMFAVNMLDSKKTKLCRWKCQNTGLDLEPYHAWNFSS